MFGFNSVQNEMVASAARCNGFDVSGAYDTDEIPGANPAAAQNRAGFAAGMSNITLSAQALPFTEEELEEMLAKVRTAKQKKAAGML